MKRVLSDIIIWIFFNAVGFFAAHFCYVIGTNNGTFQITDPNFDPAIIEAFFNKIILTWIICALFSLASFPIRGSLRYAFLLAPAIIPWAYGLSVLFLS